MGKIKYRGIDSLIGAMHNLAELPDTVIAEMLEAEADVLVAAQQRAAIKAWKGPYASGETARSIKKGRVKKNGIKTSISIFPHGKNKRGERNSDVAFINEYGSRNHQRARPAIRIACIDKEKAVIEAGEKVYNTYLDSKKL